MGNFRSKLGGAGCSEPLEPEQPAPLVAEASSVDVPRSKPNALSPDASTTPKEHRRHHHHRSREQKKRYSTPKVVVEQGPPSKAATEALMAQLQKILRADSTKDGYRIEPDEDNLFRWEVSLFGFDSGTQIKDDLDMYAAMTGRESCVTMEFLFPPNYPQSPPFLRVVHPRFHQWTGHITVGGSVCVKDLTQSGWSSQNELASFIVMIRNLLVEGHALINLGNTSDYTEQEAREAFHRVAKQHGWLR
eukprot:TRINITY_DN2870_c0_g1_i1.p1 TRINITY_DN2870_c0_g1~~TRINITY_DN2870_c0_g1_i1.p1  ORF type:complete len:247 (+),score=60.77 TRINITY_DN2870_c0_g1_i1:159-899(+)